MNSILCFTGGVDSLVAWYYLNKPKCIYFDLAHRYAWKEKATIKKIQSKTEMDITIDVSLDLGVWEQENATIPMRNMLVSMLAAYHGSPVYLVTQLGEFSLADRSPEFLKMAGDMISYLMEREVEVLTPFVDMTKQDMVKWFVENHPDDIDILRLSRSCYDGEEDECGECSACFRKWVAFEYAGLDVGYREKMLAWPGTLDYAKRMTSGEYEEARSEQTIGVLKSAGVI